MTCRRKNLGISLLEQFLAVGLIIIMVLLGLERYATYQRELEVKEINSDLDRIFFAMDKYFHLVGCKPNGSFPADQNTGDHTLSNPLNPDISSTLKLTDLSEGRLPVPGKYTAEIHQFDTRESDHKPLYQFIVRAKPPYKLSPSKMAFLLNQTNGYFSDQDNQLHWKTLPTHSFTKANATWILSTQLNPLRQSSPTTSQFNCAQ